MPYKFLGRSLPFAIALLFVCAGASAAVVPPAPADYLTDNAGVLSKDGVAILNGKLAAFARETSKPLLVYIDHHLPAGATLEAFGSEALHTWRIGDRPLDNGAILLVFIEDRKLRIVVARGLRPSLSDAEAQRIVNDVIAPRFKTKAYERGIDDGMQAMMTAARAGTALGTETTGASPPAAIAAISTAGTVAPQDTAAPDGANPSQSASAAAAPNRGSGERRAFRVPEGSNGGSRDGPAVVGVILLVGVIAFVVGLVVLLGRDQSPYAGRRSSPTLMMFTQNTTQHTQTPPVYQPPVYQPPAPPVDTSSSGGGASGGSSGGSSGGDGGASGSW
jgi:uncharacterized membrane protein YgcG